jgi:hypothetical protein
MPTAYTITLLLHSWNRWLILAAGLFVIYSAFRGYTNDTVYSSRQKKGLLIFIASLHLQLAGGVLLYFFLSPLTAQAFSDFSAAMKDGVLRFWAVEHAFINLVAIIIAQTGSIRVRKATYDRERQRRALLWTSVAILLILTMIPLGMMGVSRPLFRM